MHRNLAALALIVSLDEASIADARERLSAWPPGRTEESAEAWQAAGYNPPWTLPWLRRNEVMVPVSGGG